MADTLYFSRDTKMYVKIGSAIWEIPVLDGFSFSQGNNSTEVTLSEAESSAGVSKRGRKVFNDSLAPVEFSFSTYARPFLSAGSGAGAAPERYRRADRHCARRAGADERATLAKARHLLRHCLQSAGPAAVRVRLDTRGAGLVLEVLLLLTLSPQKLFMKRLMLQITISETDLHLFQSLQQILQRSQEQEVVYTT